MAEPRKGVKSFEDLYIFQEARELAKQVYAMTQKGPVKKDWGFVDQIRRSAVSILSNIAEGFDRQTRPEFIRALFVARGSCAEVRAQLWVALDQKYLSSNEHEEKCARCRRLSAGIYNLIRHLRHSLPAKPAGA
jgi:four helix bundle protein